LEYEKENKMNKEEIQERIEKLQEKLKQIEAKEQADKNKLKTLIIDGYEYETKTHHLGEMFKEIIIPKGWELWTYEDCIKLHNSKYKKELELEDCWFFIKQPFKSNKENDYIARFYASSGRADLYCNWDPDDHGAGLGVRFRRKVVGRTK